MRHYLIFLFVFFYLLFFSNSKELQASCDLSNREVQSCGTQEIPQEFGNPDNPTTPFVWDNLSEHSLRNSFMKFYNLQLKNDGTIFFREGSKVDIQLYNNLSNIVFDLGGSPSNPVSLIYRGGSIAGSIDATIYGDSTLFSTGNLGTVKLNIAGPSGDIAGTLVVGVVNADNSEESASIIVKNLQILNGNIRILNGSELIVEKHNTSSANFKEIEDIRGGGTFTYLGFAGSDIINIKNMRVRNADFHGESIISTINAPLDAKYIFRANSTIDTFWVANKLELHNNAHVLINKLDLFDDVSISEDSTLEIFRKNTWIASGKIDKIQGSGTLHLSQTPLLSEDFYIKEINLANVVLDNGILLYITGDNENNKIKNISKSSSGEAGGNLIVDGNLSIENINYLDKLTLSSENSKLSIGSVDYLGSLELNGGSLYLNISDTSVLKLKDATLNAGELVARIEDTYTTKAGKNKEYKVISASNFLDINMSYDNLKAELASWYSYNYFLSDDGKDLMLELTRDLSYKDIIQNSSYSKDERTLEIANYLDAIINSQEQLGITAQTFYYIDALASNNDALGYNINSLVPLSQDKYLKTAHFNLKEALNTSKTQGIQNKEYYKMARSKQTNSFWFVSNVTSGEYDNSSKDDSSADSPKDSKNVDAYKSTQFQFGSTIYSEVSYNNREELSYSVVGGFSSGDMENANYTSKALSFNIGNILDYRDQHDIVKLSLMYGLSLFDTNRSYFISEYAGDNFADLDKSQLKSSLRTHQLLADVQYSHEVFLEDLNYSLRNTILTPRVYVTPSVLMAEDYKEQGEYSSVDIKNYVSTIFESGVGLDLSKSFYTLNNDGVKLFVGADATYRHYDIPEQNLQFSDVGFGIKLEDSSTWSGVVLSFKGGISFDYKGSQFSASYKKETADNYFQDVLSVGYKYMF